MNVDELRNYLGLLVRIETDPRGRHAIHTGILIDVKGQSCLIRNNQNRLLWIKSPLYSKDSFELLDGGL